MADEEPKKEEKAEPKKEDPPKEPAKDEKKTPEPKAEEKPKEVKEEGAPKPEEKSKKVEENPEPKEAPKKEDKPASDDDKAPKEKGEAQKGDEGEAMKSKVEAKEPDAPKEEKPAPKETLPEKKPTSDEGEAKKSKDEAKEPESPKDEKPAPKDAPPEEKPKGDKPKEEKPAKGDKTPESKGEVPKETPKKEEVPKPPKRAPAQFEMLLFGKYDTADIVVNDLGLARYINLDPISVPHSGAKHANRPFAKGKVHIIERLVNNMMRTEDNTGKKTKSYTVVVKAFEIVQSKTKKNPVQVFIDALENSTPREEVTRLRYGGVSVPKAVDTSSSRRLDIAIRNICKGAVATSHKNTKPIEMCLANEIMLAAKGDMNSYAVAKKEEVERIAGSAR
jgi:small subunit ribosomal protein S7